MEPDVTRASARSRKTSFTTDPRHGSVRHVCDQHAGGYAVPTCTPLHVIFSPEMVFMVISVLTLFANYFDTGILSARRVSSMTHSLHPPMTKTRCVPILTPASANSTVTGMRIDHPRCLGRAGIYAITVIDPTIRNGSNSQHVFSPRRQSQTLRLGPRLRLGRAARRYNPAVLSLLQSQHRLRRLADYIEHNFR